jgi:hypothetical protein
MNAWTPPTPRAWNGSSSGNANAVASPHIRKNKEVVMVFAGSRLQALAVAWNCRCTGFVSRDALHVSIFDAFCYQKDK